MIIPNKADVYAKAAVHGGAINAEEHSISDRSP